jgi:broad specificity phosphatase PhoE
LGEGATAAVTGVILIRHAMPEVERGVSSRLWKLSASSLEDCVLLAHALPERLAARVFTSNQPKVVQTAGVIALRRGLDVVEDERLREVEQDHAWIEDYRSAAVAYLQRGPQGESAGWEPHERAIERFGAGVQAALEANRPDEGDVLVVNHGLAMSLWVGSVAEIALAEWWSGLTFPDAWRVDLKRRRVEQLWMGGAKGD